MGIYYNQEERVFRLDTPGSTYLISIVDEEGFLCHTYYGRRIPDDNMGYLLRLPAGGTDFRNNGRQADLMGRLPAEYPGHGLGDFRESCLQAETPEGYRSCGLTYLSHKIYSGKPALPGLPATYGGEEDCATLELRCHDRYLDLEVSLLYTAFEKLDVICRSARIENCGGKPVTLTAALSACLDMDNKDFDLITLHGSWAYERMVSRRPVAWGRQGAGSLQGISSAEEHPFLALAEHTATQDQGQVYAMHLVYSGNFLAQVEMSQQEQLRAVIGIHPRDFAWRLAPGESFQTPEAVLAYSCTGLDGMTHALHDLYRNHLTRGPWKDKPRPSLVNNWEATYFKFDTEKLLDIARTAAGRGIEMLVLDDGWFGCRDTDTNSLGDWVVNEKKLPGGLKYLADEVNKLGMKFGLWVEPEMVCPDSNLFRAHPDYALQIPGRPPMLSRTQLVLDLSRKEVRDCIYDQLRKVLSSANIEYVKWDMNRPLTDVASFCLEGERQGELFHLYYSPQIWTSDNTDAVDRLRIQEGTALIYPLSTMGAHVAACPSHTNGRSTPFETRGLVSLPGCFGYELDLTKLTEEELAMIPGQLENYRKYGPVFHDGDYYRLASYGENQEYDALMAVTKDKKTAVIDYVHVMSRQRRRDVLLPLRGLDEEKRYRSSETGEIRSGAGWMYGGLLLPNMKGDFLGKLIVLEAV